MSVTYVKDGDTIKQVVEIVASTVEKDLGDAEKYQKTLLAEKASYQNVIDIYQDKLDEVNARLTLLYGVK